MASTLRVFDLTEFIRTVPGMAGDTTLTQAITKLQEGKSHVCPKCSGSGGFVPAEGSDHIVCDVCQGAGKTIPQYESYVAQTAYRIVGG